MAIHIQWRAHEYEHRARTGDWFWTAGLVGVVVAAGAFYVGNFLLGILVLLSGATIILYAVRPPRLIEFSVSQRGLHAGSELYPYAQIRSFCIHDEAYPPILTVLLTTSLFPKLKIPLESVDPDHLRALLLEQIKEEHHDNSFSEVFSEAIGF